mmetsp:Transcript_35685/g.34722  ORF Transcript_35685/g.34722 Transcript_35685/m.34722 type:complete len:124 (-) Transcript_35685:679-1050(-)|eukprot:CAMPEP_0170563658 /NCGR_PEP_ID=MMETSP0211-20121228/68011_1 /TAXON_ID=311385 /ORGANISM="Pseudokeronopsis sp., Strain OXSARD2" /LENGTH=123 /DNA_ID=CAMNT_0010882151 /DNA_START=187 /DNA_END=558 /DNA_ORIENTATION=-
MGCPKKFSIQGGMGSALMKNRENAKNIMKGLVDTFGQLISVSCKIRALDTFEETLSYVLDMQSCGIHFLSIHPRTQQDETKVPARWYLIKKVIESGEVKIPIFGSGDLFSPQDISKFMSFTGA